MSSYITDVGSILTSGGIPELKNSTNRRNDVTSLDMTDFLNLMVVQLQNQSIDSSMDTSDMLNQMVMMQMVSALTNMTDASVMSYASSLVGKEVTIGDRSSGTLEERVVTITGSGISNGTQVIFAGDEIFNLSSVMAVGRLPSLKKPEETEKPTQPAQGAGSAEGAETEEDPENTVQPVEPEEPGDPTQQPENGADPENLVKEYG